MDTSLFFVAGLFVLAGAVFIYLTIRDNARPLPEGGLQWATTVFSLLLMGTGALALLFLMEPPQASPPANDEARIDEPAENFSFYMVDDDRERTLHEFDGQVVLINFWATWCPPCLDEMPELNRLQADYADEGLVILTISDESPRQIKTFEDQVPLETVSGYVEDARNLPEPFDKMVRGRPVSYVIDRDGIIRDYLLGAGDYAFFENAVQPYLSESIAER